MREEDNEFIITVLDRGDVLSEIIRGANQKRTIDERLSISRPTIDRAIRELEEQNLVNRTGGKASVTPLGEMAHKVYRNTTSTLSGLKNNGQIINSIPQRNQISYKVF
ncbi:hypothetical protein ACLI4Z_13910 [Natrialbaceae archaeon A-arb3/5]